jgi:fimbrial chaperone protein
MWPRRRSTSEPAVPRVIHGRHHLLAAALTLLPLAAGASGLRLSPLRLDVSAASPSAQVELTNLGTAPVAVQVKAFRWSQAEGRDAYEPTKDIFFAPPIVTVQPQATTMVRFRLRAGAPPQAEGAYRVYFQELAPPADEPASGMAFRLRFGVPLFLAAQKPMPAALKVGQSVAADAISLELANTGHTHLKIEGIELYARGADRERPAAPLAAATHSVAGTNYLLPGTRHAWRVSLPPGQDPSQLQLLLRTDDYSGKASPGMSNRGWLWLPVAASSARAGRP